MNSVINFVEFENRVVSAIYRNLMIGAKVVLVDKTSDQQLPDPVTTIASPAPHRLAPDQAAGHGRAGDYYLKALNGHGAHVAQSVGFHVG